jgi:hypothetical protein
LTLPGMAARRGLTSAAASSANGQAGGTQRAAGDKAAAG